MPRKTIIKMVKRMKFDLRECEVVSEIEVGKHATDSGIVGRIYLPHDWIGRKVFVVSRDGISK